MVFLSVSHDFFIFVRCHLLFCWLYSGWLQLVMFGYVWFTKSCLFVFGSVEFLSQRPDGFVSFSWFQNMSGCFEGHDANLPMLLNATKPVT